MLFFPPHLTLRDARRIVSTIQCSSSSCRALRSRASFRSQGPAKKNSRCVEFFATVHAMHYRYLTEITVRTCAKAADPLTALTPLVEPALADTRPSPLSLSFFNSIYCIYTSGFEIDPCKERHPSCTFMHEGLSQFMPEMRKFWF